MTLEVLSGMRVIEFDAIGPAPFCGMMLADHGASVVRLVRPGGQPPVLDAGEHDLLLRRRLSVTLDLKNPAALSDARALIRGAHVLIEGYRPGVMERLGLGPDVCLADNPGLVYGRVTGYGQHGPLAQQTGHDINFIALSGALQAMGDAARRAQRAARSGGQRGIRAAPEVVERGTAQGFRLGVGAVAQFVHAVQVGEQRVHGNS